MASRTAARPRRRSRPRSVAALASLALALALLVVAAALGPGAVAADRDPIEGNRAPMSGFYDLISLAAEHGAPGIAHLDEETCTFASATQPAVFAGNLLLNCDDLGIRNETTVAINPLDPDNVVAGSHRYRLTVVGATVLVHIVSASYAAADGGATWTNVVPSTLPYQFIGDPVLAFDSRGNAYYTLIADHEGQGGLFTNVSVVIYRSTDGGFSWQGPVTIAPGTGGVVGPKDFNDKVYMAVDTSPASPFRDRVYVTWTRFLTGPQGSYIESPIYLSYSDDGVNWSPEQEISGADAALCPVEFGDPDGRCDEDQTSQPIVGPDGTVYVAFENFQSPDPTFRGQTLIVRSSDGGNTWEGPFFVNELFDGANDYPINTSGRQTFTGCNFRNGAQGNLTVDPATGTLYLIWGDNRNGTGALTDNDVFITKSTDGGTTWSAPKVVSSAANDQFYPWGAIGPGGEIVVGYMDRQYQPAGTSCQYGFTVAVSKNGGSSFTEKRVDTGLSRADESRWFGRNTAFIGDYNNVAVGSDGSIWAVWTDLRRDVTFAGVTGATQDAVAAKVPLASFKGKKQ